MIPLLSDISDWGYKNFVKPVLFLIPPDHIHENFLNAGKVLGQVTPVMKTFHALYAFKDSRLEQEVGGVQFSQPLGLAAGYDYLGLASNVTASFGIGWHTMGTITAGAYPGNKPPMYGRLPHSKSLWVNKGFKSPGATAMRSVIKTVDSGIPVGASIGATNKHYDTLKEMVDEYIEAFKLLKDPASVAYYEVNISCPNLHTAISLYEPESLRTLLRAVNTLKLKKPIFIKMPVDISDAEFTALLDVIVEQRMTGIIVGNLTKKRINPSVWQTEAQKLPEHGGLSGKPTQHLSDHLIRLAYLYAGSSLVVVGCGGIFTAEDAYRKIRLGATLLQFVTGMIFEGPMVIGRIHSGMVDLLERDGFTHLSEVVGIDAKRGA